MFGGGEDRRQPACTRLHTSQAPAHTSRSLRSLCADEVGALVLDLGTQFSKAGYAGEDTPKAVFHTVRWRTHNAVQRVRLSERIV